MSKLLQANAGIAHLAYGIKFQAPWDLDSDDLWFGNDFNWLIDNWVEDTLAEIEADITSVDSTNLSEARSEQMSAQSSADRAAQIAAGITPSEATSRTSAGGAEDSYVSTPNRSGSTSTTSTTTEDEEETTPSHEHSAHHWGHHGTTESIYSGQSPSDDGHRTGLSNSEGTSQDTGEASTLSSVSFTIVKYFNRYENNDDAAEVFVLDADDGALLSDSDDKKHNFAAEARHSSRFEIGNIGGLEWLGDDDNEKIFGTGWFDNLFGGKGDDELYGFEGNDYIEGGNGADRILGGAGDDVIYIGYGPETEESAMPTHGDFASGGSGNDRLIGDNKDQALFGGVGHDYIDGDAGDDHIDGEAGDDELKGG